MAAAPIPQVTFKFPNNNLGLTPGSPGNTIAIVGPCTRPQINLNQARALGGSADNVVTQAGYGPVADLAANMVQGGATVVVVPCAYTAATPSAVVKVGTGLSVMTVTGSPFDRYMAVRVRVTRSATVGATIPPRVRISLDNGISETGDINVTAALAAIATITGLTLNFTTATMVESDTYTFTVGYPTVVAADVVTALTALKLSREAFSMVYVAAPFGKDDTATIVAAVGTFLAKKRFVRVFTETVDAGANTEAQWMTALATDFEGFASDLACIAAGYAPVRSLTLGCLMWRSIGWLAAVRASLVAISRDLGARADNALCSWSTLDNGGPIMSLPSAALPTGLFVHDETAVPGLNADQFMTLMSEQGLPGYYITNPNLKSGPVSDYNLLQYGRISDEIARLTNIYFTLQLSSDILLDGSGKVLDKEARKWEEGNNGYLAGLTSAQNVSSLGTDVGRDSNIINNEATPVTVRWQPKGYAKVFAVTVSMSRTGV